MKSSLKIGSVLGIPIRLHFTFLLVLPLLAFSFAEGPSSIHLGFSAVSDPFLRYSLGTASAILLFVCVIVHEIAHSYVAKRNNIKINDITLYLFGGVSAMEEVPRNPSVEMRMAIVGPLTSIVLGVICGVAYLGLPGLMASPAIGITVYLLAYMNLMLGIFNIIPAFPMDGGRVFRALLAMRMPYIAATRWAVFTGKMFAYLLGIIGLFMGLSGIWLIIIAFFIYVAAGEEERSTVTSVMLEGMKVRDIMSKNVDTVDAGSTVSSCLHTMFERKHLGYPVLDGGKMIGIITLADVSRVPETARDHTLVRGVMTRNVITLKPDDDAVVALQKISQFKVGRIVVMDGDRITGIVSRSDIVRALELHGVLVSGGPGS
ncbi:MAG TPA: CBS domain-containing protein [Methanocella sp.]|nr:CBS domain-containing protein [Methanocella sp.]